MASEYLHMLGLSPFPDRTPLHATITRKTKDGSVFFGIDRFPAYGQLSQLDRRELRTGASGRIRAGV